MSSVIYMRHSSLSLEGCKSAQSECKTCISVTINNDRRYIHMTSVSIKVRKEANKTKF